MYILLIIDNIKRNEIKKQLAEIEMQSSNIQFAIDAYEENSVDLRNKIRKDSIEFGKLDNMVNKCLHIEIIYRQCKRIS